MAKTAVQKISSQTPIKIPTIVTLPMRQALASGEGLTSSVVNDIPRRSPVSMRRTISIGVRIACPVMTRPTARKSTCTIFLVTELSV